MNEWRGKDNYNLDDGNEYRLEEGRQATAK